MDPSEPTQVSGLDLHLELDGRGRPRAALESALRAAIRAGRLPPRLRLPSSRALAAELKLARGTVTAAYNQLVAEGYLEARVGSGTVVAHRPHARLPAPPPTDRAAVPRFDLRPGVPDVTTFPTTAWLRATRQALVTVSANTYGYSDPGGRVELRTALADYLGRTRGLLATADQIVVTTGFAQALALLTTVVGGAFAMEDPGLPLHREIVLQHGGEVLPLPVDEHGARAELLLTRGLAKASAAVLTSAHQYPLGAILPPRRRHAAVAWARDNNGLVIEDDYDGEFRYDGQPVGALQGICPNHVAYVGTASKTLGPAVRLGWMVLPPRLVEPVRRAKLRTDLHTGVIDQLVLANLITTHAYDRHVRSCRLRYRWRRDLLVSRLRPALRHQYTATGSAAGLHVTIGLPEAGPREPEVLALTSRHGLALGELGSHWHTPGDHPPGIIVGYGTPSAGSYTAAIDVLIRVLRELLVM